MKNDLKDIKGLFVLDNREATLEGIKKIKKAIIYTSGQIKQLHDGVVEEKNIPTMCTAIINNFFWLVDTLDKSKESQLTKDLDYLYKHCLFSIIRVRDFNDYDFKKTPKFSIPKDYLRSSFDSMIATSAAFFRKKCLVEVNYYDLIMNHQGL